MSTPAQGNLEGRGIGIVRDAHLDAAGNQLPGFRGVAHDGHERIRFLAGEQFIEDQPAQLSCGTRYCNGHVALLISGEVHVTLWFAGDPALAGITGPRSGSFPVVTLCDGWLFDC